MKKSVKTSENLQNFINASTEYNDRYNYETAVRADVARWILDNEIDLNDYDDSDNLIEYLNDELFACDAVTGNASGSYTFNAWKAEKYLCHNLDILQDAIDEFGGELDIRNAEACDVTIRCYLLGEAVSDVVNNIWEELEDELQ